MAGMSGTPVIILRYPPGDGQRALSNNIMAARAVANAARSTLGPKGMNKMLVDALGDVTITNDGVTILKEMDVQHPAAKMIIEASKTQDTEVGDGTTTVAILAGELLKKAEGLLDMNVHPTLVVEGYRLAAEKSLELLKEMAENVKPDQRDMLIKISKTAMTGKWAESVEGKLPEYAVDLVLNAVEDRNGKMVFDWTPTWRRRSEKALRTRSS